jgi:hypothetical protein
MELFWYASRRCPREPDCFIDDQEEGGFQSAGEARLNEELMEQPVKDKAPKPPGLMPRNLQAMAIAGLAFLMVAVMALTARKPPVPVAAPTAATPAPPPPV